MDSETHGYGTDKYLLFTVSDAPRMIAENSLNLATPSGSRDMLLHFTDVHGYSTLIFSLKYWNWNNCVDFQINNKQNSTSIVDDLIIDGNTITATDTNQNFEIYIFGFSF